MCLAIPMQIKVLRDYSAICEARGVEREVGLLMLQHERLAPGDFLMVHLGQAMQKMSQEEAQAAWAIYDEMLGACRA